MGTVAPPIAFDDLERWYAHDVAARMEAEAALARATRPYAALGKVVAHDLELVQQCLQAAASGSRASHAAFSFWAGRAHASARALVLARPEGQTNRSVTLVGVGLRLRWTEDAVRAPLPAPRWVSALGVACLADDDELVTALTEPGWQERLAQHGHETTVPSRHRLLLTASLAALVRGDDVPDLAPLRNALKRDVQAPREGPDGIAHDPGALERDVAPLLAAIEALSAPTASPTVLRAAWDAYVESCRAAPRACSTVLFALARVATRRGLTSLLPAWAPAFDPADRLEPPRVEDVAPLPPLRSKRGERDPVELARCAEAMSTATTTDDWAVAQREARGDLETIRHVFAHGAWWPRAPIQACALISALTDDASEELVPERVDPALVVRGLAALSEPDVGHASAAAFVLVARAIRQARPLLLRAALAPPLARLVELARALEGDELDASAASRLPQAVSELFDTAISWPIVESDDAGTTAPVARERVERTLERVAGRSWREALGPSARPHFAPAVEVDLRSELGAFVDGARAGTPALEHRIPALGARGSALLDPLAGAYDALLGELRAGPSPEAARAAVALGRLAAWVLERVSEPVGDREERYFVREPLVWAALPEAERKAARARALEAIAGVRLGAPGRSRRSWWDAEDAAPTPAPPPAASPTPPRRRRIVS